MVLQPHAEGSFTSFTLAAFRRRCLPARIAGGHGEPEVALPISARHPARPCGWRPSRILDVDLRYALGGGMGEEPIYEAKAAVMGGEGWDRTLAQAWELWFRPEIERRQTGGSLPAGFTLYMAQALFPPDGKPRVLLNDEIMGEGLLRAPRAVQKGERLYSNDLQYIESFELPDELLDSGHFTIVRAGEGWRVFFNFLSGRAKAKDMLDLAGQFLDAALSAKNRGHAGPAVDNLFSAFELTSKAELILHRNPAASSKSSRTSCERNQSLGEARKHRCGVR